MATAQIHSNELPNGKVHAPRFIILPIAADRQLRQKTISICERNRIEFAYLSPIQKKFLTHYRCSQCGLLPLYYVSLLHPTRVRCGKCWQLIGFKNSGKYGKMRKEIAFELTKGFRSDIDSL